MKYDRNLNIVKGVTQSIQGLNSRAQIYIIEHLQLSRCSTVQQTYTLKTLSSLTTYRRKYATTILNHVENILNPSF